MRLYRDVEQVWNPVTGEWEFAGTMGKADCSTCDWSGTEDETEGPLCRGCGKPEAACSANPCAAVAADRGDDQAALIAQLVKASDDLLKKYTDLASSGDAGFWDPEEEAEVIAARTALAAARGEG
jgi:hypothetical protein